MPTLELTDEQVIALVEQLPESGNRVSIVFFNSHFASPLRILNAEGSVPSHSISG